MVMYTVKATKQPKVWYSQNPLYMLPPPPHHFLTNTTRIQIQNLHLLLLESANYHLHHYQLIEKNEDHNDDLQGYHFTIFEAYPIKIGLAHYLN